MDEDSGETHELSLQDQDVETITQVWLFTLPPSFVCPKN